MSEESAPSSLYTSYEMIEHDDDIVEVSRNPRRAVSSGSPSLDDDDDSADEEHTRPSSDSEIAMVAETDRLARQVRRDFIRACSQRMDALFLIEDEGAFQR